MKALVSIPCECRCFQNLQDAVDFVRLYQKSKQVEFDSGVNKYVESFVFDRRQVDLRSLEENTVAPDLFQTSKGKNPKKRKGTP